jgi:16S rRNA (guanine527-N7)-methyltransferase
VNFVWVNKDEFERIYLVLDKTANTLIKVMLAKLNLDLGQIAESKLKEYALMLEKGLQQKRLTGESSLEAIILKQILDSLYPLKLLQFGAFENILDLGTGGGLPGIPIKICQEHLQVSLLDSNKRKMVFLQQVVNKLNLQKSIIICGRAESVAHEDLHRERYDSVISKAVAETSVLAELALPFLKLGGTALFYKGPRGEIEAERAKIAIDLCGGEIIKVWRYTLYTGEFRSLYAVKKVKPTPAKYPRSVGKPAKRPLGSYN